MANRRQGQVTEGLVALQSQGFCPDVDGEPLKKAGAPEVGPSGARVRTTTWLCVGWGGGELQAVHLDVGTRAVPRAWGCCEGPGGAGGGL